MPAARMIDGTDGTHVQENQTKPGAEATREKLRTLPILELLDDAQLSRVIAASRVESFPRRVPVLMKGPNSDQLAFLLSGRLQVVNYLIDGREVALNIIEAGHFFGELSVIDQHPRSATLVTLVPSTVMHTPGTLARELFFRIPRVTEAMMMHLTREIRRMSDLRAVQSLPNAYQRVCALLDHMKEAGPQGMWLIHQIPTHQDLATMINTSRETVTRALSTLADKKIVEKDLRRLIIRRPEALRRLAEYGRRDGD